MKVINRDEVLHDTYEADMWPSFGMGWLMESDWIRSVELLQASLTSSNDLRWDATFQRENSVICILTSNLSSFTSRYHTKYKWCVMMYNQSYWAGFNMCFGSCKNVCKPNSPLGQTFLVFKILLPACIPDFKLEVGMVCFSPTVETQKTKPLFNFI